MPDNHADFFRTLTMNVHVPKFSDHLSEDFRPITELQKRYFRGPQDRLRCLSHGLRDSEDREI